MSNTSKSKKESKTKSYAGKKDSITRINYGTQKKNSETKRSGRFSYQEVKRTGSGFQNKNTNMKSKEGKMLSEAEGMGKLFQRAIDWERRKKQKEQTKHLKKTE